jgi:hypothetical protein
MKMEQQKKTMSEAVRRHADGETTMFDFQPGNGTRYVVLFTTVKPTNPMSDAVGLSTVGGWVMTWVNGGVGGAGVSMVVANVPQMMALHYLTSRLQIGPADGHELLRLIRHATGRMVEARAEID